MKEGEIINLLFLEIPVIDAVLFVSGLFILRHFFGSVSNKYAFSSSPENVVSLTSKCEEAYVCASDALCILLYLSSNVKNEGALSPVSREKVTEYNVLKRRLDTLIGLYLKREYEFISNKSVSSANLLSDKIGEDELAVLIEDMEHLLNNLELIIDRIFVKRVAGV